MCYLTLRVVSSPRPLLAVAALRRVPVYNYNKPYTQKNSEKPEPYCTLPAVEYSTYGLVCIGYPIPCLGKASDPLCLGGGIARCVSAGSCGCILVRDRVTRFCMGVGELLKKKKKKKKRGIRRVAGGCGTLSRLFIIIEVHSVHI
jgi:hypothetical protein